MIITKLIIDFVQKVITRTYVTRVAFGAYVPYLSPCVEWQAPEEGGEVMGEQAKKRVERVLVMLDADELRTLDTWRFEHRMPSRSAAIRELLRMGLDGLGGKEAAQGRKSESFGLL